MGPLEFIQKESALIGRHRWEFATAAVIAAGIGFSVAEYHYAGRVETAEQQREFYKDCREQGRTEAPCPVIYAGMKTEWRTKTVTKEVPISDPAQAAEIIRLRSENAELKQRKDGPRPPQHHAAAPEQDSNGVSLTNAVADCGPPYAARDSVGVYVENSKGVRIDKPNMKNCQNSYVIRNSGSAASAAPVTNSIGSVTGNNGIVTQGQQGDNTLIIPKPPSRHLTEEIGQRMDRIFKPLIPIFPELIIKAPGMAEPNGYARDFMSVFNVIGIKVLRVGLVLPGGTDSVGLMIVVKDPNNPPEAARKFKAAMTEAGFPTRYGVDDAMPEGVFWFVVGENP